MVVGVALFALQAITDASDPVQPAERSPRLAAQQSATNQVRLVVEGFTTAADEDPFWAVTLEGEPPVGDDGRPRDCSGLAKVVCDARVMGENDPSPPDIGDSDFVESARLWLLDAGGTVAGQDHFQLRVHNAGDAPVQITEVEVEVTERVPSTAPTIVRWNMDSVVGYESLGFSLDGLVDGQRGSAQVFDEDGMFDGRWSSHNMIEIGPGQAQPLDVVVRSARDRVSYRLLARVVAKGEIKDELELASLVIEGDAFYVGNPDGQQTRTHEWYFESLGRDAGGGHPVFVRVAES